MSDPTTSLPPLTYEHLRPRLDAAAWAHVHAPDISRNIIVQRGEGSAAELIPGHVTIHDHPASSTPLEIHFMVDGQKVAVLGPPVGTTEGADQGLADGYVYLMGEWMGQPVNHADWKNRILADNGLLPDEHLIDQLAASVVKHADSYQRAPWDEMIVVSVVAEAKRLAEAVIEAHTIHASYTDAVTALDGRDR